MAQNDFTIDNQAFPATRSDINSALQALASLSSGASSPSTTFAYQLWVNTTTDPNVLNIRNSANNAWIEIGEVNQSSAAFILTAYAYLQAGAAAAPSHSFDDDRDTGMYRAAANIIGFATNGTERFRVADSGQLGIGGANYGTSGQVLTSGGSAAAPSWQTIAITQETFDSGTAATFTKPTAASIQWLKIEIWGGGGGGGDSASGAGGGGGGGGAYNTVTVPFSYLTGATITYTIGAGGAATTASSGLAGGTTSVTIAALNGAAESKQWFAYGGNGGYGASATAPNIAYSGGGGGGLQTAGINGSNTAGSWQGSAPSGLGGSNSVESDSGNNGTNPALTAYYGGGAGGSGGASYRLIGGNSMFGAGGGGGSNGTSGLVGGYSLYIGGTGGTGAVSPSNGGTGVVPGGGGGGSEAATSGAGGGGRIIFTYW